MIPGVVIIPTPTIDTLDTFLLITNFLNFIKVLFSKSFRVLIKSSNLTVNVKSVSLLLAEIFCTTISTLIEFSYNGLKIDAATPGLSFIPIKVNFALFFVNEIPLIGFLPRIFLFLVIIVPSFFEKVDLTSISILLILASCIDAGCITLAPSDAISSISS